MRILSVDDNAENLYLVEMMAKAHAHEVVSACNGVEAPSIYLWHPSI